MKIFCAIPVLEKMDVRMVNAFYSHAMSSSHQIFLHYEHGDTMISRVRNKQMTLFYEGDYDYYFHISSDLEIVSKENIFDKLLSWKKDFIGALYAPSMESTFKCTSVLAGDEKDGLFPVKWLSGGCWMLSRSAVKEMVDANQHLIYDGDRDMTGKKVYGLFNPFIHDDNGTDLYLSEDWAFCQRWLDLDNEIFADPSIKLRHWGWKGYE